MRTILTIFFLGFLQVSLLGADKDTSFTITGNMNGFTDGTQVKLQDQNTGSQIATAKILNNKFTLKGSGIL